MAQLLSATVQLVFIVSVVYFFGGFIFSVGSKMRRKNQVCDFNSEMGYSQMIKEIRYVFNTVEVQPVTTPQLPSKSIPSDRVELCKLAYGLGLKKAWSMKSLLIQEVLKSDYGYV